MEKNLRIVVGGFGCAALALCGILAGYHITAQPEPRLKPAPMAVAQEAKQPEPEPAAANVFAQDAPGAPVINAHTHMVYEYVFPEDGFIETTEESAPYFLLNMDEERLAAVFPDWTLVTFSPEEVVMRKELEGRSAQHYILGVRDGYVSVFYQRPVNGATLKEITSTPVCSLSEDEQIRLAQGVMISGEDELIRVLEDYSS